VSGHFQQPCGSVEGERQTLRRTAGFHELIERDWMGKIAVRGQQGFCFRTACRQHNVFPDRDSIAGKPESLSFRHHETFRRSDPFGKNLLPITIECERKMQEFAAAQGAQAGVEVIEPAVD